MSYIGRDIRTGAFRQLDDISSGFDGSDTTHTMQVNSTNVSVGDVNQILLSLGGVIQKPGTDFTVSSSTLTFTTAPAANTSFFAILLGSDNGGTVTPTDASVTTGKIVDDAVTAAKVASSGAFAIGAAGTASSIAGLPIYVDSSSNSVYTHDVSGTDNSADNNTAFGLNAADAITTADSITVFGRSAGSAITTGSSSTFFGKEAGLAVTEGTNNIFMGVNAGHDVTTGGSNIAIGSTAYDGCDTESHNIAIGRDALGGSIAGSEYNVAVGNYSLDALTSGDHNVAIGDNAGTDMTTAGQNVLVGSYAGPNLTTGSTQRNIMIGYASGFYMTDETNNIGIGKSSCGGTGTPNGGEYNVAVGNMALEDLTSGDSNTTVGYNSMKNITTGANNVCVGYNAMGDIDTGSGNVNIGDGTGNGANTNHSIVIGQSAQGKGSNTGFISPNGGAVYQGNNSSSWSTTSDRRIKKNIVDNKTGLEKINKIKVRNFEYRLPEEITEVPSHTAIKKEGVQVGAIAQEIQEVLPDTVVQTTHGVYSVNPDNITWYLVNAVQELSAQVEELKTKLKEA